MKIDQIEVGKDYYSYDCSDNGVFRLLKYTITSKQTWKCAATRYQICEFYNSLIGVWEGYPDNLYKTVEEAIKALQEHVKRLIDSLSAPVSTLELVNPVSLTACCDTCENLDRTANNFCGAHKERVSSPAANICKDGSYKCDAKAMTEAVRQAQTK